MKKQTRKLITISILILIVLVLTFVFNIFSFRYLITGVKISTENTEEGFTQTLSGKDLNLPTELKDVNLVPMENDKIVNVTKNTNAKTHVIETSIEISTNHSSGEIIEHYKTVMSSPMVSAKDEVTQLIGGVSDTLIKVRIEPNKYTITLETR